MIKAFRISFIISLAILLLGGCTKNKRNDILGSWKLLTLRVEPEDTPYVRFTFYDNLTVRGVAIKNGEEITTPIEATYSIKYKHLRYELTISRDERFEIIGPDYRGTYVIDELSRDVLRLIRIEGLNDAGEWSTGGDAFIMLDLLRE